MKNYNKILKNLKNKKLIIYGAGKFFCGLNIDFSELNVIGIVDIRFGLEEKGNSFHNIPIIPYPCFNHNDADYILLTLEKPTQVYKYLTKFIPKNKIISLVKIHKTNFLNKVFNKFKKENNTFLLIKQNGKKVFNPKIKNLTVKMYGNNNYIEIHEPFVAKKVLISCRSNSRVIINANNNYQEAEILLGSNNELCIGRCTTAGRVSIILRESKNTKINIGNDCMLSYNVIIRTEDAHTIYDTKTFEVINKPQDVTIGNHVWIAPNVSVLKGSNIPSNCVVGTYSLINKKFKEENTILAGIPAKVIKHNINWNR